jgi:hypothetical protein
MGPSMMDVALGTPPLLTDNPNIRFNRTLSAVRLLPSKFRLELTRRAETEQCYRQAEFGISHETPLPKDRQI